MDAAFKILGIVFLAMIVDFATMPLAAHVLKKQKSHIAVIVVGQTAIKALATILLTLFIF